MSVSKATSHDPVWSWWRPSSTNAPRIARALGRIREEGDDLVRPVFDLVLVDESSQVDMAIGVGPLALLKETFQLVVAGDHLQMPPVFQVDPPVGAEHLVGSLEGYLKKRFGLARQELLENYRSHADIVAYTKRLGYPAELTAANGGTSLRWCGRHRRWSPRPSRPEAYDPTAGLSCSKTGRPIVSLTYPDGMAGQANPFEASCVATLARALFLGTSGTLDGRVDPDPQPHAPWTDEAFWERGVGVVTPHRAQRAQVLAALEGMFPDVDPALIDGAVDTVERFQGGQRTPSSSPSVSAIRTSSAARSASCCSWSEPTLPCRGRWPSASSSSRRRWPATCRRTARRPRAPTPYAGSSTNGATRAA